MEDKSKILKKATDELLEGVENFENIISNLISNPLPELVAGSNYFLLRGEECKLLIILCNTALLALPVITPPTSKIRRIQYESVKSRLQNLVISFGELQLDFNILYPLIVPQRPLDSTQQGIKTAKLLTIATKAPEVIKDLVVIKGICFLIKKAFEF